MGRRLETDCPHQGRVAEQQHKCLPSEARKGDEQTHACMRALAAASRLASRLPSGLLLPRPPAKTCAESVSASSRQGANSWRRFTFLEML